MNSTSPSDEPRPGTATQTAEPSRETLSPDQARQGEIVFGKPWKRQIFLAVVCVVPVIGLVLIIAFT